MSSGLITELMFNALDSASDFVYSVPPTFGPSSMFSIFNSNSLDLVVADGIIYPCL